MMLRSVFAALIALAALAWPLSASAREEINDFTVEIDVRKSGDILVTETIDVTVEGRQIRRGIFRDLPRYYKRDGVRYSYDYDIERIERDGKGEPYTVDRQGNGMQIRIGDADVFLDHGRHDYVIEYSVKNQVRYFDDYDEIYWNVTGNYWFFPIEHARAVVRLPKGAKVVSTAAYTGRQGASGRAYRYSVSGNAHIFETTKELGQREGLTVAVGFEKGVVDPPSAADKRAEWFQRNASGLILASAIALLSLFYGWAFIRAGQDPAKGPVFPRYEPPEGLSPAATHHVYRRKLSGHDALIATILNLGVKDAVKIDAESKKKTKLTLLEGGREEELSPAERNFLHGVFNRREEFTLGDGYDSAFTHAYKKFQREIGRKFGKPYFKWNAGYLILGAVLTIIAIIAAISFSVGWTWAHTAGVGALAAMFAAFAYFIPAPTPHGQKTRTEIEGFRLYLKTAEKIYLDAVKVGSDAPPPMTVERYERFLPYAVALGVEEPWTRHFERLIPEEAAHYQPRWVGAHGGRYSSLHGLNSALVAGMATGVASALPQSSSSSGSGGGGFSGGGGGGGGGGGW
ncbi:DUF2207 domain-containing protein [Hyphococcus luteus]|uniref:DUF2207 domain-containing protein n=1 Tax=Hyphococcus luteus TaxID=2058213 RepID=A0A2S7K992_9PROT|nr:DUF2207 domain-containing protein [Marinicaulis flavus]PQA89076.1 hypothetical protein CW354_03760 [Marinicaulis flavus]